MAKYNGFEVEANGMKKVLLLAMAVFILAGTASAARIPHMINIQGYLTNTSTETPYTGDITLTVGPASATSGDVNYALNFVTIPTTQNYAQWVDVDASGIVWATNVNSNTLTRIDPATNTVTNTIPLNPCLGAEAVAVGDGGRILVSCYNSGSVVQVDSGTKAIISGYELSMPEKVYAMDARAGSNVAWVAGLDFGKVYKIQQYPKQILATYTIPGTPGNPRDIVVGSDGTVWIAYANSDVVGRIVEPSASSINVCDAPLSLAIDASNTVWVACNNPGSATVTKISSTGVATMVSTAFDSSGTGGIAVDARDNAVWVREKGPTGRVYKLDSVTLKGSIVGALPGSSDIDFKDVKLVYDNLSKTFWAATKNNNTVARFIYNYGERTVHVDGGRFNQLFGPFLPATGATDSYRINVTADVAGTIMPINNIVVAAPDMPS